MDDVLLDTLQQLLQHLGAHQLGLVINGRVAEPVTIVAVDVASRCNLYQQLRDRLIAESGNASGSSADMPIPEGYEEITN